MLKKALLMLTTLIIAIFTFLPACIASDDNRFVRVSEKGFYQVFLSPNFAQDKTAFAFMDEFPKRPKECNILLRSRDGGITWQELPWLIDNTEWGDKFVPVDFAFAKDGRLMLTGYNKDNKYTWFAISENGGDRWQKPRMLFPDNFYLYYIEIFQDKLYGMFYPSLCTNLKISYDWGTTWDGYNLFSNMLLGKYTLVVLDDKTLFVISAENELMITRDGGKKWDKTGVKLAKESVSASMLGKFPRIKAVKEADGKATVVANGPGGMAQIYISVDQGDNWRRVDEKQFEWRGPDFTASRVYDVGILPGGLMFAGTPDHCVMVSEDYGYTWNPITSGLSNADSITDVQCVQVGDKAVVFASTGSELYRMEYSRSKPDIVEGTDEDQVKEGTDEGQVKDYEVRFVLGQDSYQLNGVTFNMDAKAYSSNGRTYIPIRYVAQALGATPEWNADTKTATLTKDDTKVEIVMDSKTMTVNGEPRLMDVIPENVNGRVYIPLRYAAEAFGYQAKWESATQSALIIKQ